MSDYQLSSDASHEEAMIQKYPHLEQPKARELIVEQRELAEKLKALRNEDRNDYTLDKYTPERSK